MILIVPLAAVVALATARLVEVVQGAQDAGMVRSLTALSVDASELTHHLHKERMAAAIFLAPNGSGAADTFNQQTSRTDQRISAYRKQRAEIGDDAPAPLDERLRVIDAHLDTLAAAREEVVNRQQSASEVLLRYGLILTDLVGYGEGLGQLPGEAVISQNRRAVAAFARARAATAEEEAVAFAALVGGQRLDEKQLSNFVATLTQQQEALLEFTTAANSWQRGLVEDAVTGDAVGLADAVAAEITSAVGKDAQVTAQEAAATIGAVSDLMRFAETQLEARLLELAEQARADVLQQAVTESVLVLLAIIIAIVLAVMLARSLNESLRRLREGALSVANHDLPEAVRRLRDVSNISEGGVDDLVRQMHNPIRLQNRDEVGQVAQAFNIVHKEAVRVAAEQAALRASVSAMFLNLARRSQSLVDRMIGELDMIERGEEDPKRLAQLFELDHLATRMRRNDENLLVLAGADSAVPRREDALVVDVLRAAQSEVEAYDRIEFSTVDTDVSIAAHAVNDVVRLVAELFDNGARFSPPTTSVVADARRIRDYVVIQVEDRGLGLREEQLGALNRRLAAPPDVEVATFRLMGLAVVSRLASRHAIRVQLRRTTEGGTVAEVTIPNSAVALPQPGRDQDLQPRQERLAVGAPPAFSPPALGAGSPAAGVAAEANRGSTATLASQWRDVSPQRQATRGASGSGFASGPPSPATVPQSAPPAAAPPMPFGTGGPLPRRTPDRAGIDPVTPGVPQFATPVLPAGPAVGPAAVPPQPVLPAQLAVPAPVVPQPPMPTTAHRASPPVPDSSGELPIFREMEAVWFRTYGNDATAIFTMPAIGKSAPTGGEPQGGMPHQPGRSAGSADRGPAPGSGFPNSAPPAPVSSQRVPAPAPASYSPPPAPQAAPPPPAPVSASAPEPATASRPTGGNGAWRTAADEGWALASRAADPASAGTTRSGLPKRVPQAQLVPGGVETGTNRDRSRRTPDEVRGLLSAYHRGVQRGRTVGGDGRISPSTKETSQ